MLRIKKTCYFIMDLYLLTHFMLLLLVRLILSNGVQGIVFLSTDKVNYII